MNDIIQFVMNHWLLSVFFAIILLLVFIEEIKGKASSKTNLSPSDAVLLINHEHATILDVRAEQKFLEGHIIDAINIPALSLTQQIKKLSKYQKKPILICADVQQRTAPIEKELKTNGFENVYSLAGGIQAWINADFPLTKK